MLIFIHQIIVEFTVLVDLESNYIVLFLIPLTHLGLLHEVLLNTIDCSFELKNLFFKAIDLVFVSLLSLLVGS
jgi:hypothetical protein